MSTGVIAGLIWIGFAAHRPRQPSWRLVDAPDARRTERSHGYSRATSRRTSATGVARRNITPGEEFTGYS